MKIHTWGLAVLFALLAGDAGAQKPLTAAPLPAGSLRNNLTAARRAAAAPQPAPSAASGGVDWRSAIEMQRRSTGLVRGVAPGLDQAAVDRTALPILLPNDAGLMAMARLYSFGDYYTITADTPGGRVSLSGTTATVPLPPSSPLRMPVQGPEQLTIQRTVDGQLASFTRYGVLYTVELRCNQPSDPRCRNDALVRAWAAKSTLVLMGRAARKAAGLGN